MLSHRPKGRPVLTGSYGAMIRPWTNRCGEENGMWWLVETQVTCSTETPGEVSSEVLGLGAGEQVLQG